MSPLISSTEFKEFIRRPLYDEKRLLAQDSRWPKISIVTPSFQQGEFLERCILSVLNQNYPNLEYIVIDGGSRDQSIPIIKSYEKFISFWVSEKDKGQSDAINKGFLRSSGEIIAWLNSDDIYLPGALFTVARHFQKHPDSDFLFGDLYLIDAQDNYLRELKEVAFSKWSFYYAATNLLQPSSFWRRDLFFEVGMLRSQFHYSMDVDLWLRMLKPGARFAHKPIPLAGFRFHESSKTISKSHLFMGESNKARKEILGQDFESLTCRLFKKIFTLRKFLLLLFQGNALYVGHGIVKRLQKFIFKINII